MKQIKLLALLLPLIMISVFLVGCTTPPEKVGNSTLTAGEVKRQVVKGVTTQAEIMSYFGSPNLVTTNKDNKEVWAYNRMSSDAFAGSHGGSLILFGGSQAVTSTTTKSFDLIITFNDKDVVEDYKVVQASY